MSMLRKIQMELDEQKIMIQKSAENVTERTTENINKILDEKFVNLEEKYGHLNGKVENQEKRLYFLEKEARQRNIVFFGIEETEKSYYDLETTITGFIDKYFSIKLERRDVQAAKRLGKKGEKTRPISVTFATLGQKINIFKQKRVLNNTIYYINEDYPQNVLEKRRELQEKLKIERENGNYAKIKYDKLIVTKNIPSKITAKKKRTLSGSPENVSKKRTDQRTQANKKNKPLSDQIRTHRSASLSEGVLKPGILNFLVNKNSTNKQETKNQEI